jgi:hypothetical protein
VILASWCLVLASLAACGNSPPAQPALSPQTAAASASPSAACPNPEGGSCLGPVASGTYGTTVFRPIITYRVPAGWGNFEDLPGNFLLIPPGGEFAGVDPGTSDYVGVYASVVPDRPGCDGSPAVEQDPTAIARWYGHQRAFETTTPYSVSVGGLDGIVLDLSLPHGSDGACFLKGTSPSEFEHGLIPGLVIRLYLLRHGPDTLAIEVDDVAGGGNHLDAYSSVVDDFGFAS